MTGYGVKFLCPFKEVDTGTIYRIGFHFRGWDGAVEEINGGDEPFSYDVGDDERTGVKPTKAQIRLFLPKTVSLQDFYAESDRDVLVTLEKLITGSGDLVTDWKREFTGWASPFDAREPYGKAPYGVTISATCGLNSLADFPFYAYPTERQFSYPQRLIDCLITALSWTGYEIPLWVSVRIFEENMLSGGSIPTGAYDPLKHVLIHLARFKKNGQWDSCKQVLDGILTSLNAVLLQDQGVWKVLCVGQIPDAMYVRNWITYSDFTQDVGVLVTENPQKVINKLEDGTPLSATLGFEPAVRRYELTFDYGEPVNVLKNGDFSSGLEQWQGTVIDNGSAVVVGNGEEETPYGLAITGTSNDKVQEPDLLFAYSETTIPFDIQKSIKLTLSGKFLNTNCSGAKIMVRCDLAYNSPQAAKFTTFYLQSDGSWTNSTLNKSVAYYLFQKNEYQDGNVWRAKPTAGEGFSFEANRLPVYPIAGTVLLSYRIRVFLYRGLILGGQSQTPTPKIEYRDLVLTIADATRVALEKEIISAQVSNLDVRERRKKQEVTLLAGDQTSAIGGAGLRYGALLREFTNTPTRKWYMALSGGSLQTGKLQNLCAFMLLRQTGKQGKSLEGDFKGYFGPLSVLHAEELGIYFWAVRYRRSVRTRKINIHAVQIQDVRSGLQITGQYEGSGGLRLPMADATSTEAVVLPGSPFIGLSQALQTALKNSGLIKLKGVVEPIKDTQTGSQVGGGAGVIEDNNGAIIQVIW